MAVLLTGVPLGLTTMVMTSYEPLVPYAPAFMTGNFFIVSFVYAVIYMILFYAVSLFFPAPKPEQVDFMASMGNDVTNEGEIVVSAWYRKRGFWYGLFFAVWIGVYWIF